MTGLDPKIVTRIATARDNIGKRDPELATAIGDLLMLLVDAYYELRELTEKQ